MRLRPFEDSDRAGLLALWIAAWTAAMPDIDFVARGGWLVARVERLRAEGALIVCAADAGRLVGFVTVQPRTGELDQLAVAPAWFGRGAARRLLDAAKAASPAGLWLDVNQANPRAAAFYRREGFVVVADGVNPASGLATWRMRWPGA